MIELRCDKISPGLRASEAIAEFADTTGKVHYIRVERDFLSESNGVYFLPIGMVKLEQNSNRALIELPHEAETGANRIWVIPNQLQQHREAVA
ncbi:hypothetical protein [Fimbriiglobus ruber]|uniref:Uncharacterized protein n=1 Tax=Fimbriiglobus ruber TaxID=1908690 RepID=A0A225E4F1_9BACT|nr:hypothetical protein [Fimbriiglobus ruber]OWK45678.1 hypothetical protein FRUB_02009 [Fimbriiglobus ruber]